MSRMLDPDDLRVLKKGPCKQLGLELQSQGEASCKQWPALGPLAESL